MIKLLTLYFSFVLLVLIISGYLVYVLHLPSPRKVILTIFLIIVSPLLVGYLMVFYIFPAAEVTVPDVTWRLFNGSVLGDQSGRSQAAGQQLHV